MSGFFLFLLLEVICLMLVVRYNQSQNAIYTYTANKFSGFLQEKSADTYEYLQLKERNDSLAKVNARLLDVLTNAETTAPESTDIDTTFTDSLLPQYTFIEARVIKNSINRFHNYLVLNKGRRDGIVPHSGVVTGHGVAGIVRNVSNSTSVVMSILHRQTRISARIKGKGFFGSLMWKGADVRTFNLEDIPKHALVVKGDTIETSGYSAIFPEGIMLGVVDKVWMEPGSNYYKIEVQSSLDMGNISYVYVVNNLFRTEREQLEQAVSKEDE
jgi:rod shape-determining protein MreC